MTTSKTQAQAVQSKLEGQYPGLQFGLGKEGADWTVELRESGGLTVNLPSTVDGVSVRFRSTGHIEKALTA